MNATPITQTELIAMLCCLPRRSMATLITRTVPRMRMTGNPHAGNCWKVSAITGMLRFDYAAEVNRHRIREGLTPDFTSATHPWGDQFGETPFRRHRSTGDLYLRVNVQAALPPVYVDRMGNQIDARSVQPFLVDGERTHRQGLHSPIIERDYAMLNVVMIGIGDGCFAVQNRQT